MSDEALAAKLRDLTLALEIVRNEFKHGIIDRVELLQAVAYHAGELAALAQADGEHPPGRTK